MRYFCNVFCILSSALLFAACSPLQTGVVNGALTTNQRPAISIIPNAPFTLADSGRVWVSPRTDSTPGLTDCSFDYAVYTDPASTPAEKLAYAAIIRLEDGHGWNFVPQGKKLPGSFGSRKKVEPPVREGFAYTLQIPATGDWAGELLAANDMTPPEVWLAKRWLFSLDKGLRAFAEYREPWPANLDVPGGDDFLISSDAAAYLRGFDERAAKAFSFEALAGDFGSSSPESSSWKKPPTVPDVARIAGDIRRIDIQFNVD